MIVIRAKSVIKLDTGQSSLDYTYPMDTDIDTVVEDLLRMVLVNKGATETRLFLDEFMRKNYDRPGCGGGEDKSTTQISAQFITRGNSKLLAAACAAGWTNAGRQQSINGSYRTTIIKVVEKDNVGAERAALDKLGEIT